MSTIKVDTIQSRQHSASTINLTSTGATVNGDCTATTFSGSGASLTALPAANLTGTLPAIDGSALTGLSAGALEYVTQNVVASGTTTTLDFTNLTSDTIYRMEGIVKYGTGVGPDTQFQGAFDVGGTAYTFGNYASHNTRNIYYNNSDTNSSVYYWQPYLGGYSHQWFSFVAEFSTYLYPWFRLQGHSLDQIQHCGHCFSTVSSSGDTTRLTDLRIKDSYDYGFQSPTRVRLFKYVV